MDKCYIQQCVNLGSYSSLTTHPDVNIREGQPNVHRTFVYGSAISEYNVRDACLMFAFYNIF